MTVDARTYPLPRKRRTGPPSNLDTQAATQADVIAAPPRSRFCPFIFTELANKRITVCTPRLIGPAILRKCSFFIGTRTTPPATTVEFGWAPTDCTEAGATIGSARPYTLLTELIDPFNYIASASGEGYPLTTTPAGHNEWNMDLDLIVTEQNFVFTTSLVNNGPNGQEYYGHMLILENVNPAALSAFTGS